MRQRGRPVTAVASRMKVLCCNGLRPHVTLVTVLEGIQYRRTSHSRKEQARHSYKRLSLRSDVTTVTRFEAASPEA
jgi:hypothetical protein